MAKATVTTDRYTVESLYQWDKNQELVIYGLSLDRVPEIHFINDAMDKAIVRQSVMDSAGVVTAKIPNSLLQKPYKVNAYVCVYAGDTFETLYLITIPMIARKMPADYTLTVEDEEVYSFNALENKLENALKEIRDTSDYLTEVRELCDEMVVIRLTTAQYAESASNSATEAKEYADSAKSTVENATNEAVTSARTYAEKANLSASEASNILVEIKELVGDLESAEEVEV